MQAEDRTIAACLGLTAFSVAIVSGLAADNPALTVLGRAVLCMIVAYAAGGGVSAALRHVAGEHVKNYIAAHPVPEAASSTESPPTAKDKKSS